MAWLKYSRTIIKPYRIDPNMWGIYRYGSLNKKSHITKSIYANVKDKTIFYWDKDEIIRSAQETLRMLANCQRAERRFEYLKSLSQGTIKLTKKIGKMDLAGKTNGELAEIYKLLSKSAEESIGKLLMDVDSFDYYFDKFLIEKIKKELSRKISQKELLELYKNLIQPTYLSFVGRYELRMLELALKNKEYKLKSKNIEKFWREFWWINLNWDNEIPHSVRYFEKEIDKLSREQISKLKNRVGEIRRSLKLANVRREELFGKYHLSKRISYWLNILDQYVVLHDVRKETQMRVLFSADLLLRTVCQRNKLLKEDLEWLFYKEIQEFLLTKKLDKAEIEKRKISLAFLVKRSNLRFLSGEKAEKLFNRRSIQKKTKILKGMGVCLGKVKGRVKVCLGHKNSSKKLAPGDILVASMTTPEFMISMRKASAIITNEGGVTCHAAIISRELKIPCVVGTKIATEVLKDGDLVEVDADSGTIRVIK